MKDSVDNFNTISGLEVNRSDSENLDGTRWDDFTLSTNTNNNYVYSDPVYAGCNLGLARNICGEDLHALDFEIPEEYLNQCLQSDYSNHLNNKFKADCNQWASGGHGELHKVGIPSNELYLEDFRVKEAGCFPGHNQSTQDFKIWKGDVLSNEMIHPIYMPPCNSPCGVLQDQHFKRHVFSNYPSKKLPPLEGMFYGKNNYSRDISMQAYDNANRVLRDQPSRRHDSSDHSSKKLYPLTSIDNLLIKPKLLKHSINTEGNCLKRSPEVSCEITKSPSPDFPKLDTKTGFSKKTRKHRTHFNTEQLRCLNSAFSKRQYLSKEVAKMLTKSLEIPEDALKNWFANRRAKYKRKTLNYCKGTSYCETDVKRRNSEATDLIHEKNGKLVNNLLFKKHDGHEVHNLIDENCGKCDANNLTDEKCVRYENINYPLNENIYSVYETHSNTNGFLKSYNWYERNFSVIASNEQHQNGDFYLL